MKSCVSSADSHLPVQEPQAPQQATDLVSESGSYGSATMSRPEVDDPDTPRCSALREVPEDVQPSTRTRIAPRLYDGRTA